jgi:hypothetical protein
MPAPRRFDDVPKKLSNDYWKNFTAKLEKEGAL